MKNFTQDELATILFFVSFVSIISILLACIFLDAYNNQQDRILFTKTYEIVLECRKSYDMSELANKICGTVSPFVDKVS